ncbi:DUF4190 domain-containing protein [Rhabdothermincola sp.]|uniref:DUF4190 domain-containing protein n=1 Tax=Rhabdothermincola sp. TaxID=2820405 RepID=UPI002FDFFF81
MSDTSQGPGWWQASDGKWYPPEAAPGPGPTYTSAPYAGASYGFPPTPRPAQIEGLAIASFVVALVGLVMLCMYGLGVVACIAAIPLAITARGRINESNGALTGEGFATAGLIIGAIGTALGVLGLILLLGILLGANSS